MLSRNDLVVKHLTKGRYRTLKRFFSSLSETTRRGLSIAGTSTSFLYHCFIRCNPELCFLVYEKKRLVGVARLRLIGRKAYLSDFIVREEYRRRGIGSYLMNSIEVFCREKSLECLQLEARRDNYQAVSFYRNRGFREIATDEITVTFSKDLSVEV